MDKILANQAQCHIKKDEMHQRRNIPEGLFNIQKSVNVIYHIRIAQVKFINNNLNR